MGGTVEYTTIFGSLDSYRKGTVEIIDDDPKHYAFSNVFEVAAMSAPYEKVAVGKNQQYVLEAIRAEGTSGWRTCDHDEAVLCMDGDVTVRLVKLATPLAPAGKEGSIAIDGEPVGEEMGVRAHPPRPHGPSAARIGVPLRGGEPVRAPPADLSRRRHDRALGRDLPVMKGEIAMTDLVEPTVQASEPDDFGYRQFTLGSFTFRRDEYFAHVTWPTGSHVMSIDAFLRALQRDCAWDFFYGTVNFDDVIGTVNHYGTVDLFAGRYNDSYRKAELDHTENFPTPDIHETFRAMLDDWTNSTFDPFASPEETEGPWGLKNGNNTAAVTRRRVSAHRMVGVPGDEPIRTDATHPVNRMFADVSQDEPEVHANPGFEDEVAGFSLYAYLSRSDVTWNPSVTSVCKDSLFCPTTEEYILPVIHGNDRVEWFVQLSDEIRWSVDDRDTGAPGPRSSCAPVTLRRCLRTSATAASARSARCCSSGRTHRPTSPN